MLSHQQPLIDTSNEIEEQPSTELIQPTAKKKEITMQVAFGLNDERVPQMSLRLDCICVPQISKSINAVQATTYLVGTIGTGAGFLYFGAMPTCVKMAECGKWLSKLTTPEVARWTFFASGASGFGLTNFYFSVASIPAFIELMKETPSKISQIGKTGLVIGYVVTQTISIYFAAESGIDPSESRTVQTIMTSLTVGGAFPGQLFAATNLVKNDIPAAYSSIKSTAIKAHRVLSNCAPSFFSLSENEKRRLYYIEERDRFLPKAKANWRLQLNNLGEIGSINFNPTQDLPLTILFQNQDATPYAQSWCGYLTHKVFWLGGFTLASSFTLPLVLNSYDKVKTFLSYPTAQKWLSSVPFTIPTELLAGPFAFLFSASAIYSDYKIILLGTNWIFDALANILSGNSIGSLFLQLRPLVTLSLVAIALGLQSLSYGLLAVIWQNTYQDNWPEKQEFGYVNDIGIVLYHTIAWVLLFTSNPSARNRNEEYLFAVKKKLEELATGPLEKFIKFVEDELKGREEDRRILNLESYDPKDHATEEELETGELGNLENTDKEMMDLKEEPSYEKEETDNENEDDEEMGDETANLIRRKTSNISSSSLTLFSKDKMPVALREKQAAKRCCSIM